jgi:dimethylhistidine N-methyltransferase
VTTTLLQAFAADVARDLQRTPKQLQSHYLYDDLGSRLFDAICRLPWYRITRAEATLLTRHGPEIAALVGQERALEIVELGVGNGEKLVAVVEAISVSRDVRAHLVDISPAALDATESRLARFPHVSVVRHGGTYEQGLASVRAGLDPDSRALVLFLGSNIGNFSAACALDLLRAIRNALREGDSLLLGADLVKPEADLIAAYDDPLGVTAAFNKNLLVRINRELGGEFALELFDHQARWRAGERRIEMHLVSRRAQDVWIAVPRLRVHFDAGESIWTESSYKYTEDAIADLGAAAGFDVAAQWVDADAQFALTLLRSLDR